MAREWFKGLGALVGALSLFLAACGGGADGVASPAAGDGAQTQAQSHPVGGQVAGLAGTLVLRDASGQELTLTGDGDFRLGTQLPAGTAYAISVAQHPAGQGCTVSNGVGTVAAAVTDIRVACATSTYPITVDVNSSAGSLVVESSLGDSLAVQSPGSLTLPTPVAHGQAYALSLRAAGQACSITGASGTATGQPLRAQVHCAAQAWRVGGTVQGLLGSVSLNNSDGQVLALHADGAFQFANPMAHGSAYAVTVATQPAGQACTVSAGGGNVTADVADVVVACQAVVVPPPPAPAAPANLAVGYEAKAYTFRWDAVPGATRYELFEDPDGPGPQAAAQLGGALTATSYTLRHNLVLHQRIGALYTVRACHDGGCGATTPALQPDVTRAIGYFKASNTGAGDRFGGALALSADGGTLAVAAPGEDSSASYVDGNQADDGMAEAGAVYVYLRTPAGWVQHAYLKNSWTQPGDGFGSALALSADGTRLAIGAPGYLRGTGRVVVYERGTANVWWIGTSVAGNRDGDAFGSSVALSADGLTLAAGAPGEDSGAAGTNGNSADVSLPGAGSAYVFLRSGATAWTQVAYLKASNPGAGDRFGQALALSSDGSTLAVGAPVEASGATGIDGAQADDSAAGAGAVYVFARAAGWAQQAYVKAGNARAGAAFGSTLALSADGGTLAVGAELERSDARGVDGTVFGYWSPSGATYVFGRAGNAWTQQAFIKGPFAWTDNQFGASVALSADGNMLAVGSRREGSLAIGFGGSQVQTGREAGALYLYGRVGGAWSLVVYVKASNTHSYANFGHAAAISADGSTMAVGAPGEDGRATGVQGDPSLRGPSPTGAVYLY